MAERFDEWPRVHTCLYNWCPSEHAECARCDEVCRLTLRMEREKIMDDHPRGPSFANGMRATTQGDGS